MVCFFFLIYDGEQWELTNKYDISQIQEPPKPGKCFAEKVSFPTTSPTLQLDNILPWHRSTGTHNLIPDTHGFI